MTSDALANLVKIRKLKAESSSPREFDGLMRSAVERATDARNASLALASRFTLAYDAGSVALSGKRRNFSRNRTAPFKLDGLALPSHKIGRRMPSHWFHRS